MAYQGGAHVIVLGNEKGGSGKSTTAMHVIVALLRQGRRVGAIDLDSRQQSLGRYLENRRAFAAGKDADLPLPEHRVILRSDADRVSETQAEERARFTAALQDLASACDFVVIDCPGTDSFLSRLAHGAADTLITPLNDSFVDFDLLARVDSDSFAVLGPSLYSEMVWEGRKRRAVADRGSIDWVVMRNRVASLDAHNKRRVGQVLDILAKRIGFRVAPGFGERVIYRELFLSGLTLLDLREGAPGVSMTMSHVAARQEVRDLLAALKLPGLFDQAAAG